MSLLNKSLVVSIMLLVSSGTPEAPAPWLLISLSLKFMVGFELLTLLIFIPRPNCVVSLSSVCSVWLCDTLQSIGLELTFPPPPRRWFHNKERTSQTATFIAWYHAVPSVVAEQRECPLICKLRNYSLGLFTRNSKRPFKTWQDSTCCHVRDDKSCPSCIQWEDLS